jgi:adenylylsulfate kinase
MLKKFPGFTIWLTGLPSSGKTTLANAFSLLLSEQGVSVQILDSDDLRRRLTPHPIYSDEERDWFYNMVIFLAELLTENGVNVLISATAPRRAYRNQARSRIKRFAEVYVDCPEEECRKRDSKGLWEKADKGEITALPGAGVPYEPPDSPEVKVDTAQLSIEAAANYLFDELEKRGMLQPKAR